MKLKERRCLILLGLLWVLIQVIAYYRFGILTSVDTSFYLADAELLSTGQVSEHRSWFYLSYSGLLAIIQGLGFEAESIVWVHLLASAGAMYSVYVLSKNLFQSKSAAVAGALLYILWIKIHQWNFIVYTDSLFCSLVIVSFTLIHKAKNRRMLLMALPLFVFTVLLRPNGMGFVLAILSYWFYGMTDKFNWNRHQQLAFLIAFAFVALFALNALLAPYVDLFVDSYKRAEIIYPNRQLILTPETDLTIPSEDWPPLAQLFMFGVYNPVYFGKLCLMKGVLFLAHVKPYFSWLHNLLIVAFLYPTYFFALRGYQLIKVPKVLIFTSVFIGLQIGIVALTSENWDGRFLLPILPLVFVLASGPIDAFLKSFSVG